MPLSEIVATDLLQSRPRRRAGQACIAPVPRMVPHDGATLREVLRTRCDEALLRCSAQSAGISIFDNNDLDELTWVVIAGTLAPYEGRRFPRSDSPCGLCLSYRSTQLFVRPHQYFRWMAENDVVITEALVAPLIGQFGAFFGTIWVMSHDDPAIHFTLDDADTLADLSRGLASAIRLNYIAPEPGGRAM